MDWIYVDNLVHALILASRQTLTADKLGEVRGRAFFITDGRPINNSEFMNSLIRGLGYDAPRIAVPFAVIYRLAHLLEFLSWTLRQLGIPSSPFLSRAEVQKCGISHYFTIDLARKSFGYEPLVFFDEGMRRTVSWFQDHGYQMKKGKARRWWWFLAWFLTILVVFLVSRARRETDAAASH